MVAEAWSSSDMGEHGLHVFGQDLGHMSSCMQRWAREVFGSIKRQIASLKKQLLEAKLRAASFGCSLEVHDIEDQLHEIYAREEILYRQRSRVDWLKARDQNMIFFPEQGNTQEKEEYCKGT